MLQVPLPFVAILCTISILQPFPIPNVWILVLLLAIWISSLNLFSSPFVSEKIRTSLSVVASYSVLITFESNRLLFPLKFADIASI
jgi:hypothetical protein